MCSHTRAHDLFIESLKNATRFVATKCASYGEVYAEKCSDSGATAFMGGDLENMDKAFGVYHLKTNSKSPFAIRNIISGILNHIRN